MAKDAEFRSKENAVFLADQAIHLLADIKTDESIKALFKNIEEGLLTDEEFEGSVIGSKIALTPELQLTLVDFALKTENQGYAKTILNVFENVAIAKTEYINDCVDALYEIAKEMPADKGKLKVDAIVAVAEIYGKQPLAVKENINNAFQALGTAVYKYDGVLKTMFNGKAREDRDLSYALGKLQFSVDIARIADFKTAIAVSGNLPARKK